MKRRQEDIKNAREKVNLLAASVQVLDKEHTPRDATVLLDTGSELSFIGDQFAKELGLPVEDSTSLTISTFGSHMPMEKSCNITTLKICDIEGREHAVRVYRSDYITGTIEQVDLDSKDLDFISRQTITLSLPKKLAVLHPQILLGCDYLWNFMMSTGKLTLPSGLQLIPTKFGCIVSGCQRANVTQPTKILTVQGTATEKETWDRYWSLESSSTHPHTTRTNRASATYYTNGH
ncbi:Tas retrotransposon peptidase A16 [Ancylostoma ceylanicum]|uniref:Tas retrotransposon peptidase A16 n=2 Tax=Ancylostoma ceylanicum TaxID=53326 RepID=A0A0D6M052_9BILA|nr:Tas retrotransposon peptidase A16 [Ancylostoma ceylanicum]EYC44533.1 hypothetical protein Y032_0458g1826 [Ancylostoma ceylanicum]